MVAPFSGATTDDSMLLEIAQHSLAAVLREALPWSSGGDATRSTFFQEGVRVLRSPRHRIYGFYKEAVRVLPSPLNLIYGFYKEAVRVLRSPRNRIYGFYKEAV